MADGKVVIDTGLNNKGIRSDINGISGAFGGLKNVLGKIGGLLSSVFAAGALISFSKAAIDLGSDLAEVQNVVDVSFGSMSAACEDFAKSAIMNFGMSELAAKRTSSTYMAMAKGLGVADEAARDMSINLAGLSGDVASFFNLDQEVAAKKLQGIFTGESEALKELGVVMTQANLKQFAMEKGMNANIEAMSQAELVSLRYAFVTDALSLAAGDFIRTQDSWANQTRILSMQWESFMSTIGQTLTTILLPAVKALNSMLSSLIGMAQQLNNFVNGLFGIEQAAEVTTTLSDGFESASDGAKTLEENTKKAGKAAKSLAGFDQLTKLSAASGSDSDAAGAVGAGIGGTSSTVTVGGQVNDAISPKLQGIIEKIQELIAPLKEIDLTPLKNSVVSLWDAFSGFAEVVGEVFSWVWFNILVPLAEWVIEEAAPAGVDALSAAFEGLSATIDVILECVKECWAELQPIFTWIGDTVLVILEDLKEIGQKIAAKWQENEPKIKQTFKNIGTVIQKVWTVVGPILTWLRDALSTLVKDGTLDELQLLFDRLFAISEILAGIVTGDVKQVFNGFGAAIGAETEYAESKIKSFASTLGIDLDAVDQWVKKTAENIGQWFSDAWNSVVEVWEGVATWFDDTVIAPLKEFWAPIGEWFGELFGSIEQTLDDVFYNIGVIAEGCWEVIKYAWEVASDWFDENVIQPVASFFEDTWADVSAWAAESWAKIQEAFTPIANWFDENVIQPVSGFFEDLWDGFKEKAEDAWEDVKEVFADIAQWGKDILNELIRSLNSGLTNIFSGINKGLGKLKDMQIGEIQPFANIRTITTPQIPYLAKGAVIPPNAPFMAVLGDQRHGTNIEAPLSTIQEAVTTVMEDYSAANMAGHSATVAVLREILEAVLGIDIGDDVLANAVNRYQTKMAIVRGG